MIIWNIFLRHDYARPFVKAFRVRKRGEIDKATPIPIDVNSFKDL